MFIVRLRTGNNCESFNSPYPCCVCLTVVFKTANMVDCRAISLIKELSVIRTKKKECTCTSPRLIDDFKKA